MTRWQENDERRWLARVFRDEVASAYVLMAVAAVTLLWANSPFGVTLQTIVTTGTDLAGHHIDLTFIAGELLLCIFFLVAGVELSHELHSGELNNLRSAITPLAAAVGGMALPALIYLRVASDPTGWAVPMATDLPFALAVLALAGRRLPVGIKAFLLALAIFDDLLSVLIVALVFGSGFSPIPIAFSAFSIFLWAKLCASRKANPFVATALALSAIGFAFAGGVHPTLAAALLGIFTSSRGAITADLVREKFQPWSSGFALPLFALTALATPLVLTAEDFKNLDLYSLAIARILGKTIGIALIGFLFQKLMRPTKPLPATALLIVGGSASLGFSVSLLFLQVLDLSSASRNLLLSGAVVALVMCFTWAFSLTALLGKKLNCPPFRGQNSFQQAS